MGSDQIHPMVLKECAMEFAIPLTKLFLESIKQGKFQIHGDSQKLALYSRKGIEPSAPTIDQYPWLQLSQNTWEDYTRWTFGTSNGKLLEILDFITSSLVEGNSVDKILLDFAKAIGEADDLILWQLITALYPYENLKFNIFIKV